jgi:hypothetical protein
MTDVRTAQNVPVELSFAGSAPETLPATSVAIVRDPSGTERRVPCFWDGKQWRARIAPAVLGRHEVQPSWSTGESATVVVDPYEGDNDLYRRGAPVRQGPHLARTDGKPFLWLGDTWWFGLGQRISDDEFVALAKHRAAQGFTVIQIVAGLHVDVEPFSPIGNSAAGWPWTRGFGAINPAWWDDADRRIKALIEAGLVPCIVGAWGYYLQFMTDAQMEEHWRNVIARWGAYPVIFCAAGEVALTFYQRPFTPVSAEKALELNTRWTAMMRYIRATDPHRRLLTAHPAPGASQYSTVESLRAMGNDEFDINVLQTGHSDVHSLPLTFEVVDRELGRPGGHPVMNIEVNYEGIGSGSFHPMQRFLWWSHMLSGCAGFTYGAQGLWGMEDESYDGLTGSWGEVGWREASQLPGAAHLGWGRQFLDELRWEELRPVPRTVRTRQLLTGPLRPYAAAIGDDYVLAYLPAIAMMPDLLAFQHLGLELGSPHTSYSVIFVNPRNGKRKDPITLKTDDAGFLRLAAGTLTGAPSMDDWLIEVLRVGAARPTRTGA